MLIGATSLTLNAGQGAAFPSSGNFRILIGSELILVGARATDTLSSLTRGIEGTAAAAHTAGDAVTHIATAGGLQQFIRDNSVQAPAGVVSGEAPIWNGTTWVRSSVTGLSPSGLAPGTNGQYLTTSGGVTVWSTPPVIAPTQVTTYSPTTTAAIVANTAYLTPIFGIVIATPISRISWGLQTVVAGNYDVGIYYSDDELTFTQLVSKGSTAQPAAGNIVSAIAATTITPVVGRRWYFGLALSTASAIGIAAATNTSGAGGIVAYSKATSFPLPASLTTVAASAFAPSITALV